MKIYKPNEYNQNKLHKFLEETDDYFIPALSVRVDLNDWAKKLCEYATIFEVEIDQVLIGIGALYFNKAPEYSYGTFVCVKKEYQKEMYGVELIQQMISYAKDNASTGFKGEIRKSNKQMVKFYKLMGLEITEEVSIPNSTETRFIMQITFDKNV